MGGWLGGGFGWGATDLGEASLVQICDVIYRSNDWTWSEGREEGRVGSKGLADSYAMNINIHLSAKIR